MAPLRPSDFANQRLYADYYSTYADDYPMTGYPTWRVGEHNAILNFARKNAATHIFATNDGWWNVATNWAVWNGSGWMTANTVPGANAQVLIGEGTVCTFNSGPNATTTDLYWIRVDGTLKFPPNANAHLVVDTILTTPNSYFEMGTLETPIPHPYTINVEFSTARGWINVIQDISKSSRGIILSGPHKFEGQEKTIALRSASNVACNVGQTSIMLESVPSYWNIGDKISLGPTRFKDKYANQRLKGYPDVNNTVYVANAWIDPRIRWGQYQEPEEEVVTITGMSGNVVTFTPAAIYRHQAPHNPWQATTPIKPWIRNLTRNIRFSSKNADNIFSTSVQTRAHHMIMHQANSYTGWAEFVNMGRTDKNARDIAGRVWNDNWTFNVSGIYGAQSNTPLYLPKNTASGQILFSASPIQVNWGPSGVPSNAVLFVRIEGTERDRVTPMSETIMLHANTTDQFGNRSRRDNGIYSIANNIMSLGAGYDLNHTSNIFGSVIRAIAWCPSVANNAQIGQLHLIEKNISLRVGSAVNGFPGATAGVRIPRGGAYDKDAANWVYFPIDPQVNIQGRYAFHVHRIGTSTEIMKINPTARGIVVSGTVGWGFAHHDSHFNFIDCIAHRTGGAGFVAERGNESGVWLRCHATNIQGVPDPTHKNSISVDWGEIAHMDSAFWFTGRAVKANDCVADGCYGGYVYEARFGEGGQDVTWNQFDHPEVLKGWTNDTIDHIPLLHFSNNEFIAGQFGFVVVKSNQHQNHDNRTILGPFICWSCMNGFEITYTQHYTMKDLTFVRGTEFWGYIASDWWDNWPRSFQENRHAFARALYFEPNSSDQVVVRPRVADTYWFMDFFHANANEGTNTQELSTDHPENFRAVADPEFINIMGERNGSDTGPPATINARIIHLNQYDRIIYNANSINVATNIQFGYESLGFVPRSRFLSGGWPINLGVVLTQGPLAGQTYTVNQAVGGGSGLTDGWRVTTNIANTDLVSNANFGYQRQGIFTDKIGTDPWPGGITAGLGEDMSEIDHGSMKRIARKEKIWQWKGNNFVFLAEIYGDRFTGEAYKRCVPYNLGTNPGIYDNFFDWNSHVAGSMNLQITSAITAPDINITIQKNGTVVVSPLTYASGNSLSFFGCTKPFNGTIVINGTEPFELSPYGGDGTFTYIPVKGFTGTEKIKYWVRDINGKTQGDYGSNIYLNVVDTIPTNVMTLQSDSSNTIINNVAIFNVLTNDTGTGLVLNSANVSNIMTGNITANSPNGRIVFTPALDYFGISTGFANIQNSTGTVQFSSWTITITQPNVANIINSTSNSSINSVPFIPERKKMRLFLGKDYRLRVFRDIIPEAYDRDNLPLDVLRTESTQLNQLDSDVFGNIRFKKNTLGNTSLRIVIQTKGLRQNVVNVDIEWTDKGMFI